MNWISVKDILPEDNKRILLLWKYPKLYQDQCDPESVISEGGYNVQDKTFWIYCYCSDQFNYGAEFTHWIPLSEISLPKEVE